MGYLSQSFKRSTPFRLWIALLLVLQFPARALTRDETILNMSKARESLEACSKGSVDHEYLKYVLAGLDPQPDSAGCGGDANSDPMAGIKKFSKNWLTNDHRQTSLDFAKALRLQTLNDALVTYLDTELRYDLSLPSQDHGIPLNPDYGKLATPYAEFCRNKKGINTCSTEELAALKKTEEDYRSAFEKTAQKPMTPVAASFHLAESQKKITELQRQIMDFQGQLFRLRNPNGIQPTEDQTPSTHKHPAQNAGIDWSKNGLPQPNKPTPEKPKKSVSDGIHGNTNTEQELTDRIQILEQKLLSLQNNGVSVLMLTQTMRKPQASISPTSVTAAVKEIKQETLKLARSTNDQLSEHEFNQKKNVKTVKYAINEVAGPAGKILGLEFDLQSSIKHMMETNPVAVTQVLIQHPEYAGEVCLVAEQFAADQSRDQNRRVGLKVVTWGGMVVGAVAMASGIFSGPGVVIEEASAAGAAALSATQLTTGAVSLATTLGSVGNVLNTAGLVGNLTYVAKDYADLKSAVSTDHSATVSHTGLQKKENQDKEKYEQASEELFSQVRTAVAFAGIGFGASKIATWAQNAKDAPKFFQDMVLILKTLKDTKSAKLVLGTIDYACMFLGKVECNLVTSALHAKAKQNPKEFEKLAGDQKALDAFVEGVTSPYIKDVRSDPIKGPVLKEFEQTEAFKRLTPAQRNELYHSISDTHFKGNKSDRNGISVEKVEALKILKKKMVELGFSQKEADQAISKLANKNAMILGETPLHKLSSDDYFKQLQADHENISIEMDGTHFKVSDKNNKDFYFEGRIWPGTHTLVIDSYTKTNGTQSEYLNANKLFDQMMKHFNETGTPVDKIFGDWRQSGDKLRTNLQMFNDAVAEERKKGLPEDQCLMEAAKKTWTGKQAAERGFTKVTVKSKTKSMWSDDYEVVTVDYEKPPAPEAGQKTVQNIIKKTEPFPQYSKDFVYDAAENSKLKFSTMIDATQVKLSDLPYDVGPRTAKENVNLGARPMKEFTIENIETTDVAVASRSSEGNGSHGLLRLGKKNGTIPVVVKTDIPKLESETIKGGPFNEESPGIRITANLNTIGEANRMKQRSDMGVGPYFEGVTTVNGWPSTVSHFVPGGGKPGLLALHDMEHGLKLFGDYGFEGPDSQRIITPDGHYVFIDPDHMPTPGEHRDQTSSPYLSCRENLLAEVDTKDGITWLNELKKTEPTVWEALKNSKDSKMQRYKDYFK